jgi:hypothetical protein
MSSEVLKSKNTKTVGSPKDEYLSTKAEWQRNRAVIQGQSLVKDYDSRPDFRTNLLLPFNPSMTLSQYQQYKAEAELPGVSSQYAKMLIGGLLRKNPLLDIDNLEGVDESEVKEWLLNRFGASNESMVSFLDSALWEELQTSRAWVQIDYPNVDLNELDVEDRKLVSPYPILHTAENIINWSTATDAITGETKLQMLITRYYKEVPSLINPFHPDAQDTVQVHYLDEQGYYAIDTYVNISESQVGPTILDGKIQQTYNNFTTDSWTLVNRNTNILQGGERLWFIPFVPLNGSIDIVDPIFTPIVDREIALYNKISRRNHLLYLSATYTPVVKSDTLTEADKDKLASQGLGTWMFIGQNDNINTLSTPTESLKDMEYAIRAGYEELTRIGVKMLSLEPNNADSSGIALQIRNASQNAQIATLNAKVSEAMKKVIAIMINWKYNLDISESDIRFNLSSDFNRLSTNAETTRLISEWYTGGLIPRSLFIEIMKNNDILPSDYSDTDANNEIESDPLVMSPRQATTAELNAITGMSAEEKYNQLKKQTEDAGMTVREEGNKLIVEDNGNDNENNT